MVMQQTICEQSTMVDADTPELAEENRALRARVDRLEELVDLMGTWLGTEVFSLDLQLNGMPKGAGNLWRAEYEMLTSDTEPVLTFVIDSREGEPVDDDGMPFHAGCVCMWTEGADTVDAAEALARGHAERHHSRFMDRHPELIGPDMTYASAEVTA